MDHFAGLHASVKETSVCIVDDTNFGLTQSTQKTSFIPTSAMKKLFPIKILHSSFNYRCMSLLTFRRCLPRSAQPPRTERAVAESWRVRAGDALCGQGSPELAVEAPTMLLRSSPSRVNSSTRGTRSSHGMGGVLVRAPLHEWTARKARTLSSSRGFPITSAKSNAFSRAAASLARCSSDALSMKQSSGMRR